jgi:hypothetical protein
VATLGWTASNKLENEVKSNPNFIIFIIDFHAQTPPNQSKSQKTPMSSHECLKSNQRRLFLGETSPYPVATHGV